MACAVTGRFSFAVRDHRPVRAAQVSAPRAGPSRGRRAGGHMSNLAENLSETARSHPERPALRFGHVVTTYAALDRTASRVAGMLRADGLAPGDRVAVMLPNVPAFVALHDG